jgi:hypothetical protein
MESDSGLDAQNLWMGFVVVPLLALASFFFLLLSFFLSFSFSILNEV